MAYNYREDCEFIVEFENLSEAIKQLDIFTDKKVMIYYIEKWVTLLKSVDNTGLMKEHFKNNNKELFEQYKYEPEYYYMVIALNGFNFQISLDIELLHQIIDNNPDFSKKMLVEIERNNFFGVDPTVQCEKVKGVNNLFREDKERPLYVCQMHINNKLSVVVDGTYRLNYRRNKAEEFVCYFLSQDFIVNNHAFLSQLDEFMYILNNELITFKYMKYKGLDDFTLLANSYVMSKKPADFFELDSSFFKRMKTHILYKIKK